MPKKANSTSFKKGKTGNPKGSSARKREERAIAQLTSEQRRELGAGRGDRVGGSEEPFDAFGQGSARPVALGGHGAIEHDRHQCPQKQQVATAQRRKSAGRDARRAPAQAGSQPGRGKKGTGAKAELEQAAP